MGVPPVGRMEYLSVGKDVSTPQLGRMGTPIRQMGVPPPRYEQTENITFRLPSDAEGNNPLSVLSYIFKGVQSSLTSCKEIGKQVIISWQQFSLNQMT